MGTPSHSRSAYDGGMSELDVAMAIRFERRVASSGPIQMIMSIYTICAPINNQALDAFHTCVVWRGSVNVLS
jgi:hypothetical protein